MTQRLRTLFLTLTLVGLSVPVWAQGTLIPFAPQTFVDANGNPLSGGKLCTYAAGTTTLQSTYSSNTLSVPNLNSNPVIMAANGRPTSGAIFLSPTSYKFVLREPGTDTTCATGTILWTLDNIAAIPTTSGAVDVTVTAGETITAGMVAYLSDGSGSKTAGRWYKADSTNTYSSTTPEVGIASATIASGDTGTIRLVGQVTGLAGLVTGSPYYVSTAGTVTATAPSNQRSIGQADSTTTMVVGAIPRTPPSVPIEIVEGRLTLTTALPVTTADVTAAVSVFFTPYHGNRIALYDGSSTWNIRTFTEITIALGTIVSGRPYDIFCYDNSGTVACDSPVAWTSGTARATALTTQDGVLVKTGATTRRYIGTFYTTSTTTTEDSYAKRYLWNYYNRVPRPMRAATETTDSWNYISTTWRQANANTANQLNFVIGWAEVPVTANVMATASNNPGSQLGYVNLGYDATNAIATGALNNVFVGGNGLKGAYVASLYIIPAVGVHFIAWIESGDGSATTQTYLGDNGGTQMQSGISGLLDGG